MVGCGLFQGHFEQIVNSKCELTGKLCYSKQNIGIWFLIEQESKYYLLFIQYNWIVLFVILRNADLST